MILDTLKKLTLPAYICISLGLIAACAVVFPDRLGSLLGFINRMFIATVFVQVVFAVTDLDPDHKSMVIGCALIGAGMAV